MSLKEKESGKASFAAEKKKSKPTSNSFLKKSVLVVIKHVYNRQLILSTGEILFIHLQHNITRKIMLVINPHVLSAVWGFWECHVYLLSCYCNPSPPTSSPDTLPTMLSPLWCTYQPISPLIFFTWMWTMLWCLTDSGWALSPVLGERMSFSFTWPDCGFQSCQEKNSYSIEEVSCSCGANACMSLFFPTTKLTSFCVAIFMSQSPNQYRSSQSSFFTGMAPSSQEWLPKPKTSKPNLKTKDLRAPSSQEWLPQTWCWAMQTCSFGVIPCWCLPTICFTEISMAMFALSQAQWKIALNT